MPYAKEDTPILIRCPAMESGGWQCEAWLTNPEEEHNHYISRDTIERWEARYGPG